VTGRAEDSSSAEQSAAREPSREAFDLVVDVPRALVAILVTSITIVVLLVVLDYSINYSHGTEIGAIRRLFNMTREDALGSWFGVTVTTLAALTAWLTAAIVHRRNAPRARRLGWSSSLSS
jgi:hypothetical protein